MLNKISISRLVFMGRVAEWKSRRIENGLGQDRNSNLLYVEPVPLRGVGSSPTSPTTLNFKEFIMSENTNFNANRNELVDDILVYLDKLRYMAISNKRNNAYVKGVRDAMKLVQSFKEQDVAENAADTLDS